MAFSWTYRAYFYSSWCEDKWFVLPERATAATSFASHSINIWTFLMFQQDNAPAHRARKTVALQLSAETPDFIGLQYWPPNSSNLQISNLFEDTIIGVKQDFKAGKPALTEALNTIKDETKQDKIHKLNENIIK